MAAGSDGQGPISVSAQLRLVVEASARMAGTLDVRAVAAALAGTVVPVFADRARVDLVSAVLRPGHEVADSDARLMSQVTDVNAVSTDGARPDGAEDWKAYLVSSGAGQALATGRARVGAGPDDSSLLWVPLAARGRVLGLVTLSRGTGSAPYSAGDAAFAAELGTRAALAFDNLRLYDE
ncbi:MAG: hypothetical protein QOJ49_1273, partial [Actinomycetota bacterium]|nr:hypothetical protein [Actinomycetota bacterium]